jgi:hypothetical protein
MAIQRMSPDVRFRYDYPGTPYPTMNPSSHGQYISFTDHELALAQLREEHEKEKRDIQAEIEALKHPDGNYGWGVCIEDVRKVFSRHLSPADKEGKI